MISLGEVRVGTIILHQGFPHEFLKAQHAKLGRGGAILRSTLKNLETGAIFDVTFQGHEKLEPAQITTSPAQYLYNQGEQYFFMHSGTFEQFELIKKQLGGVEKFLKDGLDVVILSFEQKPLTVQLPIKLELKVSSTEPGLRGDRSTAGTKPAILETGAKVNVPLFIKTGDIIKVDTRTGDYIERA